MSGETSYSPITAQVGSSKEPKGLMYMVEIQELAQSESIAGVKTQYVLLSRVNHHAWGLHVKPDELPLSLTTTSFSKAEQNSVGAESDQ